MTDVINLIKEKSIEFVDLRFADMLGKQHHVTFPASAIDASVFEDGKMFDGSSISGWKGINDSDMVLMPDADSAIVDPFSADPTLILTCDVLEPSTMQAYTRCPRSESWPQVPRNTRRRTHRRWRPKQRKAQLPDQRRGARTKANGRSGIPAEERSGWNWLASFARRSRCR